MKKPVKDIIHTLDKFYKNYKVPPVIRGHPSLFELLVRTVLSARNTDENAMAAAKELFSAYKTPEQIAKAPLVNIKKLIKRGVFYNVKAKNIKNFCRILIEKYGGKVPKTMEELVSLPGVGRKTANIVLSYGFKRAEGIAVDTHVFRVVNRIGLVSEKTPLKTEKALLEIVPKRYWLKFNHLFVLHGRNVCKARNPKCSECPVKKWCDYYKTIS